MLRRTWVAGRPVDLRRTMQPLQHGGGDPMHRVRDGVLWRAMRTPDGLATLALRLAALGEVEATAWGDGAAWALDRVPALLGANDDWSHFDPSGHELLSRTARAYPGLRLPQTGLVMEALVPAVLEQRVTGMEAHNTWRMLLYRYGDAAPGPAPQGMRVMPNAATILRIPTWDWHRWGVDQQRSRAVRAAATVASRLEECVGMSPEAAMGRLQVVPGIGAWTAAETLKCAIGDPDAVSVGDFHLSNQVTYALTGQPRGDDEHMLSLLSRWIGHRQRVIRLIEVTGITAPRFGPRYNPLDIARM